MTDQELKDLVASLAIDTKNFREAQRENERKFDEQRQRTEASLAEERKKTEAMLAEERQKTEEERRKTEEERRKTEEERRKTEEERRKTEAQLRKTDRQLRELGKQIGGLGNKFGSFTEGLALPSVQKLLFKRFGVEDFMPSRRKRVGTETVELDALGVVNGTRNEGYIVEIKSHLRSEGVQQMFSILGRFRELFTEYAHLQLYGIIVATDANADALREALEAGFYVITFEDNLMRFHDKDAGFVPKTY